ncbi:hypothetical protein IGI04_003310 [Brassica rapa subsp. trilocularis]|uniref:Uncharacterized protein n=1 Tax=Brassica rapa subsp. trilocularis TaxID=1813537 RepID=A0ABQ7NY01_BRACM|nr:hypothetical protein IGI04_003310 [Brassica rapa subsp. trilocularis]
MAATKMFLIKWYSSSTNLEIWKTSGTTYLLVVWKSSGLLGSLLTKSSGLPGSRLDFQEVVWTSRKSFFRSGFNMQVFQIWKTSGTTYLLVVWKSSGSRLDFLKIIWTSCKVVWKSSDFLKKSSGLLKSRLVLSTQVESKLVFTTYNSVVHETTEIISEKSPGRLTIKSSGGRLNYKSSVRLKCKSSGEVKLLKLSIDDLTFSRLRLQISKSIAKITSALTRRLPGKSSTARRLPGKSSTARRLPNSLAYIRLLQAHRITNESHPPIIVSFYDSMNHKNFRIKILGFFSSLWRESERYVVFNSQEWKKKKGKSILGALRASNWLFMVVVVLMTMAIL